MLFTHYGCKVNQYETNAMIEKFINANYQLVDFEKEADIYVINTCSVTNMSDRKSRQIIRRTKQINPDSILVVTGCYAQVSANELKNIEEIDLIIGNTEKKDIVSIVEKKLKEKIVMTDVNKETEYAEFGTITYTDKTRAEIKIQDRL